MLYYTVGQWYALCYMIVCGVIMGLVCEIFDVVRALTKAGQVFGATLDVIMCAALAVLATVMLVQANGGDVRMYAFLGCTVGWALFKLGPARILRAAARKMLCLWNKFRLHVRDISLFRHILK